MILKKSIKDLLKQADFYSVLLLSTAVVLLLVYSFYFIIIPQDWTLRDDYSFVRAWTGAGQDLKHLAVNFAQNIMKSGRLNLMDPLSRYLHYQFLPVNPRAFHLSYFATALVALIGFGALLQALAFSLNQILLALILVLSNFAFKEWLVTLTVSESWAMMYLALALACFAWQKKGYSLIFWFLCLFSKESFFITAPCFYFIEAFQKKSWPKKISLELLAHLILTLLFVFLVRSLPQGYSAAFSLKKLALLPILKSLLLPVLKNFGPFLVLAFLFLLKNRFNKLSQQNTAILLLGLYIVVSFSVFLNAWGPFDSWFYLHTAIPFGWAIVFGQMMNRSNLTKSNYLEKAVLMVGLGYCVLVTLNGARNYTNYFASAKIMAKMACDEYQRDQSLKIYNNCNEGSLELKEYLLLSKSCGHQVPDFHYQTDTANLTGKYIYVHSNLCDPVVESAIKYNYVDQLHQWKIYKLLN